MALLARSCILSSKTSTISEKTRSFGSSSSSSSSSSVAPIVSSKVRNRTKDRILFSVHFLIYNFAFDLSRLCLDSSIFLSRELIIEVQTNHPPSLFRNLALFMFGFLVIEVSIFAIFFCLLACMQSKFIICLLRSLVVYHLLRILIIYVLI